MTATNLDRQVERHLGEHDIRYTRGRRRVVHALSDADGPRSAAELSETLGRAVPLSSLYRTLAVLEETGVVTPHLAVKGMARYELAEWLAGHHHHLVCIDCGAVEDVEISTEVEDQLRELVAGIGAEASFSPSNHALEVEGRCLRCR